MSNGRTFSNRAVRIAAFIFFSAIFLGGIILFPQLSYSADFNSTDFISRDPLLTNGGGFSSSTSFQQINALGQSITGESTSSHFIMRSGFLYFDAFAPRTQNWRWYSDTSDETPVTALAAENTAPSSTKAGDLVKLRVTVKETANVGDNNIKFKIQYSTDSTFATGVNTAAEIGGTCISSTVWCYASGAGSDNALITTKVLSDADACASSVGTGCGTHNTSGISTSTFNHQKLAATEYEFTLQDKNAPYNTTYFFRLYDVTHNLASPFNTGKSFPSLSTGGTSLTFTISGLNSGTSTGGISTSVTTSPTTVPFGTLGFAAQTWAAQRLAVSTNATTGYQIFVFQQQAMLGPGAAQIPAFNATNASPAGWAAQCTASFSGCYGYHTTAAVLSGGSARFSANDTYAQFETNAREIAYNSGAVTNDNTDLVLQTQVTNQQQPGTYTSSIVYIIVPSF